MFQSHLYSWNAIILGQISYKKKIDNKIINRVGENLIRQELASFFLNFENSTYFASGAGQAEDVNKNPPVSIYSP